MICHFTKKILCEFSNTNYQNSLVILILKEKYMKRLFDVFLSIIGILLSFPVVIFFITLVFLEDRSNPLYIAKRIGIKGREFNLIKIRTMIIGAELTKVDSTVENDIRITKIGSYIRKYKIDELTQFFNILVGQMSFVGPRPNVKRDTDLYTNLELSLLSVKPGLTDFSSIIFSDESKILANSINPDISYNQLIRPWKSKLGLFYIKKANLFLDLQLIFATFISIISRKKSLEIVSQLLKKHNASTDLVELSLRKKPLYPSPPPGSDKIVQSRNI